ncbi:MAG: CDP-alcohol phosphatidyltransferase family protein [Lachnospiraceae bacterium]|nr:CDP-alcohol phosphatidyltransferase family protein [Lachnospiraceae bacterium]
MSAVIKRLPNLITILRIAGASGLIFTKSFSTNFYALYTFCGISDVLDGAIARLCKATSELGAKLDSAADLLFYGIMLIKLFPVMWAVLPEEIWRLVAAVILMRLITYTMSAVKYHQFSARHTRMNKISGLAIFTIPYVIHHPFAVPVCFAIAVIAGIASLEEMIFLYRKREERNIPVE